MFFCMGESAETRYNNALVSEFDALFICSNYHLNGTFTVTAAPKSLRVS